MPNTSSGLCDFPIAAVTNDHISLALNNTNLLLYNSVRQKCRWAKAQVSAPLLSLWRPKENTCFLAFPSL